MEIGSIRVDFPVDVLGLKLSLECKLRCAELGVELCHDAEGLLVSGTVLASSSCGFFCGAKRRLHLLLFLRMCETSSSSGSACDSKQTLACIRCWTTFNLDLEVAERHVIPIFLLGRDLSLFFFWLAIGLALRLFSSITLFVKFVQTFSSEARTRGLSFACFDLLEETCGASGK